MRILIISDAWTPQVNGVVRTYEHLGAEMEKAGHEVRVIGPEDFPLRIALPFYTEIEMVLFPRRRLDRMIDAYAPDVVHIGTEGPLGRAGRAICIARGWRFTTAYHTHFPDYIARRVAKICPPLAPHVRAYAIRILRDFHAAAGALLTATQSLEDELKGWGFSMPMHRLSRGVHLEQFRPGAADLFHDLPRPVALYVGRIAVEKNLEDFLAMAWDGSRVIVGDGPDRAALQKKYPDAVFAGTRQGAELASYYRSADIFVFPSRTDTFGMVLVEAMASGLPVAAYNVTGPRDIVTAPHLGALHETDLAQAARTALSVAAQKDERHAHARDVYSWSAAADQFIEILKRVGR